MDIYTICYTPAGSLLWYQRFTNPHYGDNDDDAAFSIALDNNSDHKGYGLYVAGWYHNGHNCPGITDTNCYHDAQVVHYKFDGSYVSGLDEIHYGCGPDPGEDFANAIVVSASGKIYATGAKWCGEPGLTNQGHEFFTFKGYWDVIGGRDTLLLDEEYCDTARYYNADGGENIGTSLVVDNNDYVYATGYSQGSSGGTPIDYDYITIKYDPDGVKQWVSRYNSGSSINDIAKSITMDGSGNLFITGIAGASSTSDIISIEYDNNGDTVCVARFDGTGNVGDGGNSIGVLDDSVYVTGYTNASHTVAPNDFITLKYIKCNNDHDRNLLNTSKLKYIPGNYNLKQNYPNPFNPTTVIDYSIPRDSYVSLKVYNTLGQEVFNVYKYKEPGVYYERIDASLWSSGIYFYVLEAKDVSNPANIFKESKKMLLLK